MQCLFCLFVFLCLNVKVLVPNSIPPAYQSVAKDKAEADVYAPKEMAKMELGKLIAVEFTHRLGKHILDEWGCGSV